LFLSTRNLQKQKYNQIDFSDVLQTARKNSESTVSNTGKVLPCGALHLTLWVRKHATSSTFVHSRFIQL